MRKYFLLLVAFLAPACHAQSTYTAASTNFVDVDACINSNAAGSCSPGGTHTVVNGDTVQIPCGTSTWTTDEAPPSGVWFSLIGGVGCATPQSGSGSTGASASCATGTVIIDNSPYAMIFFRPTYTTSSSFMRISCMDIEPFSTSTILPEPIAITGTCTSGGCTGFRVDNVTFGHTTPWTEGHNGSGSGELIHVDDAFGVMDHNTAPNGSNAALFVAQMSSYLGVGFNGDNSWAQPPSLGGPNNIFAENNLWYTGYLALNDCEAPGPEGCRFVIRNNTMTCVEISPCFGISQNHGTETGGRSRSGVEEEVYNNTYILPTSAIAAGIYGFRGGTGMFFNNTVNFGVGATATAWIEMSLYRNVFASSPWEACGGLNSIDSWDQNDNTVYYSGTMSTTGSGVLTFTDNSQTWTTNQFVPSGAPYTVYDVTQGSSFFSEVTSNTAHTVTIFGPISESSWAGFNNGDSYEIIRATICIDQPGRAGPSTLLSNFSSPTPTGWPSEPLTPVYQWGDTSTGSGGVGEASYAATGKVIANRDYYIQTVAQTAQTSATSPFNGSTTCTGGTCGTGWGTLAFRPTTCTANPTGSPYGVGYWETDHSQLDFCIATNTWSTLASSPPSYAPYTYPHPYDVGGTPTAATPSCSPGSGTYGSTQSVTCTDASSGAVMCYTTNGTTPATNGTTGCTTGTLYSGAISISVTSTLTVIGGGTGYLDGSTVSYAYIIGGGGSTFPSTISGGVKFSGGVVIR